MKKILLLCSLLFAGYCANAQNPHPEKWKDGIYIKVAANDCMTCTAGLTRIMEQYPSARIIMEEEFIEDSTDLKDKFNLNEYTGAITWNSSFHHAIAEHPLSEVVQLCKGRVIKRSELKGLDKFNQLTCD